MASPTPKSTQQSAAKSAADDIIETRVKDAVDAYQRGQYRSIRAAATAYDAPYHRTRSRCQGHHSRGQNGGNSTSHNAEGSDPASQSDSLRPSGRRKRVRGPAQPLTSSNPTEPAEPEGVTRRRKPGAFPADQMSTNDLLREIHTRLDRHEATVRADSATLERSLIEQVSMHMAQQEGRIGRLETELFDMKAGMMEQVKEIKLLRQSLNERPDILRGDIRFMRRSLDNSIPN